ncbi:MAG: hypothetical protein K0R47_768 [Brevibacillus sp.]|jgi:hypothetical protein|nr:hypothetical protein [Brevibacillus sp.]
MPSTDTGTIAFVTLASMVGIARLVPRVPLKEVPKFSEQLVRHPTPENDTRSVYDGIQFCRSVSGTDLHRSSAGGDHPTAQIRDFTDPPAIWHRDRYWQFSDHDLFVGGGLGAPGTARQEKMSGSPISVSEYAFVLSLW